MLRVPLLVIFTAILSAQPVVTITPAPGSLSGVTLIGPNDAAYRASVQALIPPGQLPAYQPMLPYSVLVRNDTGRTIVDVCLIFDVTQPTGYKTGSIATSPGSIPPVGARPLLNPGAQILIAAVPRFDYIGPRGHTPATDSPRIQQVAAAKSLVIGLDSAIFADGTMAGPDTQNNFLRYTAQLAADRDFAASIKGFEGTPIASLTAYLDQLDAASRSGPPQPIYDWEYNHRLGSDARHLKPAPTSRHAAGINPFDMAAQIGAAAAAFTLHH